jgi:hypothetical protein
MSHISKITVKTVLKDERTMNSALKLMQKEGYTVITEGKKVYIDLNDRCKHSYGKDWTRVTIERGTDGVYTLTGDPWSIREHFNTAVKSLEKNYLIAGVQSFLNREAYMMGSVRVESKTTADKMGKITLTGVKY